MVLVSMIVRPSACPLIASPILPNMTSETSFGAGKAKNNDFDVVNQFSRESEDFAPEKSSRGSRRHPCSLHKQVRA